MRLLVSNIGWTAAEDGTILPRLRAAGAEGIEVAPGRLVPEPAAPPPGAAAAIRAAHAAAGLPVRAMQALLFGRPDLALFGGPAAEAALLAHLGPVIAFAGALGCGPLVFGAPGNRRRGALDPAAAAAAALGPLRRIGDLAQAAGTVLCLEPNARAYGCDFMTRLDEAAAVAAAAAHPGIGLVADTGNMMLEDEPPAALAPHAGRIAHLHVSAPQLGPVAPHRAFVAEAIAIARDAGYAGSVTLEMRPGGGAEGGADPAAALLRATALLAGLLARPGPGA